MSLTKLCTRWKFTYSVCDFECLFKVTEGQDRKRGSLIENVQRRRVRLQTDIWTNVYA